MILVVVLRVLVVEKCLTVLCKSVQRIGYRLCIVNSVSKVTKVTTLP